ncbi:hypothetical protein [Streptomyces sp. NBC_01174]|uniref:hypothetical protein n=1 Tax=Streptomyces sp. NBC_01174 TaxID=2903758 RepID=UPI002F90A2A8|nr:hypothetical protein OG414_41015 [Streptomyces sp. NBC_01174]
MTALPLDIGAATAGAEARPVRIGTTWDVVRITARLGIDALDRLRAIEAPVGPVLHTPLRSAVEFLVAPGEAPSWPHLRGTRAVSTGVLLYPPPHVTVASHGRSTDARRWIVAPADPLTLTDADALCEAVTTAIAADAIATLAPAGRRRTS